MTANLPGDPFSSGPGNLSLIEDGFQTSVGTQMSTELPTAKRGFEISYADFWRLYLDAHRSPATRGVHYAATVLGAAATAASVALGEVLLAPAGLLVAVGMAVGSHRFIEHNRPLIRVNPLYGALSDLRMMGLAMTGRLPREYTRLGLGRSVRRAVEVVPAKV